MPPSGTQDFDLDIAEIIEDAYERCGIAVRSGMDFRTARRSLDLLFIEWATKGINFWTIDEFATALPANTATLTLDQTTVGSDVADVLEIYTRTQTGTVNQSDLPIKRIGMADWANLPNKLQTGRPVNVWVEKRRDAPILHFWPVPDQAYTLVTHLLTRIDDTGTPASNTADVPWRFIPAMVAGLAMQISLKRAPDRFPLLETKYKEAWADAVNSDRERRPTRFSPNLNAYRR